MSRRIILNTAGMFRVSKPGYDALTAADQNLIFKEGLIGFAPGIIGEISVGADATGYIPIADPGFVPLFFWQLLGGVYPNVFVNAAKTVVGVTATYNTGAYIRYYMFKSRAMS